MYTEAKNGAEKTKGGSMRKLFYLLVFSLIIKVPGNAQDFSVYTLQNMNFGAFFQGNAGGTIEISPDGSRTVTGDVIPIYLGIPYYQAIFEIEAPVGTIVSVLNNTEVNLPGSNGGMLTWKIGNTTPVSPFIITVPAPGRTQIHIGGTLTTAGTNAHPAGSYSGSIFITFNQE
jgi:hypothetical protein